MSSSLRPGDCHVLSPQASPCTSPTRRMMATTPTPPVQDIYFHLTYSKRRRRCGGHPCCRFDSSGKLMSSTRLGSGCVSLELRLCAFTCCSVTFSKLQHISQELRFPLSVKQEIPTGREDGAAAHAAVPPPGGIRSKRKPVERDGRWLSGRCPLDSADSLAVRLFERTVQAARSIQRDNMTSPRSVSSPVQ